MIASAQIEHGEELRTSQLAYRLMVGTTTPTLIISAMLLNLVFFDDK
jgi:hypothetical protein